MGNQFLSNIRETDAIIHVVRAIENDDIVHVTGKVSPIDDIEIINTELILSDLSVVEKLYQKAHKNTKSGQKEGMPMKELLILQNISKNTHLLRAFLGSGRGIKLIKQKAKPF